MEIVYGAIKTVNVIIACPSQGKTSYIMEVVMPKVIQEQDRSVTSRSDVAFILKDHHTASTALRTGTNTNDWFLQDTI